MPELFVLDESDAVLIRRVLERERKRPKNSPPQEEDGRVQDVHDCYVIYIPEAAGTASGTGGIPPRQSGSPDVLGEATCHLYESRYNDTSSETELIELETLDESVFNPCECWVGLGYGFAVGDKCGNYITLPMSASYLAYSPAGGIPARVGQTPGKAQCDLYYIDGSDELQPWLDEQGSQAQEWIYNLSSSSVSGSSYLQVKMESLSHHLIVDWEDC